MTLTPDAPQPDDVPAREDWPEWCQVCEDGPPNTFVGPCECGRKGWEFTCMMPSCLGRAAQPCERCRTRT